MLEFKSGIRHGANHFLIRFLFRQLPTVKEAETVAILYCCKPRTLTNFNFQLPTNTGRKRDTGKINSINFLSHFYYSRF